VIGGDDCRIGAPTGMARIQSGRRVSNSPSSLEAFSTSRPLEIDLPGAPGVCSLSIALCPPIASVTETSALGQFSGEIAGS
jgi:hypothetical protein